MDIHQDFADLCSLLNARNVEFLIVGGYAVAFHGAPRFTGDLDVLVRPEVEHVERMLTALRDFGFPAETAAAAYLLDAAKILQLGHVPLQVHIMTKITGVSWAEAWASRVHGSYGDVPVAFIGRGPLLENKRAAGRSKDLADVEALTRRKP